MKVHHLNCGTMRPLLADNLVCHVILAESSNGLVLVDSGIGLRDIADPGGRFGRSRHFVRPDFAADEAAINQVRRLGYDPKDVRDIVLTHFDVDHVGGLADFPWARVHLTGAEADAALHPRTLVERERYVAAQRDHNPKLVRHTPTTGAGWRGFAAAEELFPGVVLIGLPGHTRGHAAIAVDTGPRWVLHTGDAFYHHGQIDGTGNAPMAITTMERMIAHDWAKVQANHARLSELWAAGDPDLLLVNAHDQSLLRRAQQAAGS